MPNRTDTFQEAPIIHLETPDQVVQARAQLDELQGAEPGSVDDLLRVALEAAIDAFEGEKPVDA